MYEFGYMVQRFLPSLLVISFDPSKWGRRGHCARKSNNHPLHDDWKHYRQKCIRGIFRHALGFGKDIGKTQVFYKNNNVQGVVAAYVAIGEIFEHGDGVTDSFIKTSKYYLGAADLLSSIGQWKVATALENGTGVKRNIRSAVCYFKLSANSGNVRSQGKSMTYYMKRHGVDRSRGYFR